MSTGSMTLRSLLNGMVRSNDPKVQWNGTQRSMAFRLFSPLRELRAESSTPIMPFHLFLAERQGLGSKDFSHRGFVDRYKIRDGEIAYTEVLEGKVPSAALDGDDDADSPPESVTLGGWAAIGNLPTPWVACRCRMVTTRDEQSEVNDIISVVHPGTVSDIPLLGEWVLESSVPDRCVGVYLHEGGSMTEWSAHQVLGYVTSVFAGRDTTGADFHLAEEHSRFYGRHQGHFRVFRPHISIENGVEEVP